jgi:hypothetical protein
VFSITDPYGRILGFLDRQLLEEGCLLMLISRSIQIMKGPNV